MKAAHEWGEAVFRQAKFEEREKQWRAWREWHRLNPPPPPRLTADEMFVELRRRVRTHVEGLGKEYWETPGWLDTLRLLSEYFTEDPAFEKRGCTNADGQWVRYSLRKGLWLQSPTGRSKTLLLYLLRDTPRGKYGVVEALKVATNYEEQGTAGLAIFCKAERWYCFDDVGREPASTSNWGRGGNPMEQVMDARDRLVEYGHQPAYATHITTNLTTRKLVETYGLRMASRLAGNFNQVPFPDDVPDFRKPRPAAS